ncbi:MAG: copper transport protein [Pseudonocardiales bacterium]|jgi:copper transport protein|nr:copper transport protein [Pseudonocardiales bacterium]
MRRRLVALSVLLGGLLGAGTVLAASASAHASVVASDPVDGARLAAAPSSVTIAFDEAVGLGGGGYLHVVDSHGTRVDSGSAAHPGGDGRKVAVALKAGLGDGTYTESFRVVSADSHPVAGTVRFVVGNGVLSAAPSGTSTVNHTVSTALDLSRWVSFAGFAALGGGWLLLTVWPQGRDERRARRLVWSGWGLVALGAVLEVLLQGPYTAGTGLGDLANRTLLDATLHSNYGHYHSLRLLLLGALAVLLGWALSRERSRIEHVAWPLAAGVALTFSGAGHAATTSPAALSIAADAVHVTSMAAWIGGLTMLLFAVLPRREPGELAAVLPVVSRVSLTAVVLMAVTGTYAAWRGVGTWDAVFSTAYGEIVAFKVLLFVVIIAVATVSRRVVQQRWAPMRVAYAMSDTELSAESEAPDVPLAVSAVRIRRAVLAEVLVAFVVLGATSLLVAQPRGKEALAVAHQRPVSASSALGKGQSVTVTIDPGTHGTVTANVEVDGGAKPTSVTGTAALPSKQLGPIPLGLRPTGPDQYGASGVQLPSAGDWVIQLIVSTSEFDATTTDVHLHLY